MKSTLNHIAFIMDGNGRWAKEKNKPRTFGHKNGASQIPKIIDGCISNKIKHISFFAFSTENWKRPKSEIIFIFNEIKKYLSLKNLNWFNERDIKLNIIGFIKSEYKSIFKSIYEFSKLTSHNKKTIVNIYLNYGAQQEIVEACNKAVESNKKQTLKSFSKLLLADKEPPVDLLVRTSGEKRISNFLLWQIAYSEIIFENVNWPDYTVEKLEDNILEYNKRIRRYGGL